MNTKNNNHNEILPEFEHIKEQDETLLWAKKPRLAPFVLISLFFASLIVLSQMASLYSAVFNLAVYDKPLSDELFSNTFTFLLVALVVCTWQYLAYKNESYAYSNKRIMVKTGVFNTDFIAVEYKKIIEVSVTINPIENMFGVGTVRFFTGKTDKNGSSYDCWQCVENPYEVMKEMNKIISETQQKDKLNNNVSEKPAENTADNHSENSEDKNIK
jgi:uncharacterized membrane protein YdbT with pleckstrin-like domain